MRVAHLNYCFSRGQTPNDLIAQHWSLHRLAQTQAAQPGFEVTILQRFHDDTEFEVDKVRYIARRDNPREPMARPWTLPWSLHQEAKGIAPHVFHVHGLGFGVQVALLEKATAGRVPIVVQHHGGLPPHGMRRWLQRITMRSVSGFLFNGAGNAEPWLQAGIVPSRGRLEEMPEASSDLRAIGQPVARRMLTLDDAPIVLWVARLVPGKDPFTALGGFELATQEHPTLRLYMIFRESNLLDEIDAWIAARPALVSRITRLGQVPHAQLASWYSAADLFLTSSVREGSNYALIESQACGVPAACSDIAPHRYIAGGARTTHFFPCGDVPSCASAIVRALRTERANARAEVLRHFESRLTWVSVCERSFEIYRRVAARHPGKTLGDVDQRELRE